MEVHVNTCFLKYDAVSWLFHWTEEYVCQLIVKKYVFLIKCMLQMYILAYTRMLHNPHPLKLGKAQQKC